MKHDSAPKSVKAFDIDAKTSGIIPISEASRPRQLQATDPALLFIPRWYEVPYLSLRGIHCLQTPILLHLMGVYMSGYLLLNRLDPEYIRSTCNTFSHYRWYFCLRIYSLHSEILPCLNDHYPYPYPYPYQVVCSFGYSFALSPKSVKTESSPL